MIIGIPKEIWREERRVAMTPAGAHGLVAAGHPVIVHCEAGRASGFEARAYEQAGARIAYSSEEVYSRADLIVKVMPPTPQECGWMSEGQILLSMLMLGGVLHGGASTEVWQLLRGRRILCVGYELIEDGTGRLPVLKSMGEIAGILLPQIAGRLLESPSGGRGILLGKVAGLTPARVLILGAGTVGTTAAQSFLGSGAYVLVMDENLERLREVDRMLFKRADTVLATPYDIERAIATVDVFVGAVLIHGRRAPHVLSEALVQRMKPGSVIMDISIDQGGCVETSRPTTLSDPVFVRHDVIHFCVPNIPALVSRTSSQALTNVLLTLLLELEQGGGAAVLAHPALRRGIYLASGRCTNAGLAGLLDWEYAGIDLETGT